MPSYIAVAATAGLALVGCGTDNAAAFNLMPAAARQPQPPRLRRLTSGCRRQWTTPTPRTEQISCFSRCTRLHARGKIFGEDDEAEEVVVPAEEFDDESLDVLTADMGGDEDDPFIASMRGGASDEDMLAGLTEEELEEQAVAVEVLQQYPDAPIVLVDDMGNVIGGVDPYADEENGLERGEPNVVGQNDEWPEVAGDTGGMDDPPDAPWRREAEEIIRREVEETGLNCYDIMWSFHKLEVTVTRGDLPEDSEEAGYVDSDALMKAIRAVNQALEQEEERLWVLGRHELIIATPGAKDILTTDREFKAFKGFDVVVLTGSTLNVQREVMGKLHERTFDELVLMQKGRKVRIPLALVDEVRLPDAKMEPGEQWGN
ncbi:hypothetical protein JKP88DRAFT_90877 [Tribonema minus]|uniref:Uncharacterized protein n=1 Tax=Tribonema minus TaxID=303371 RepID=A0A836C944_9STRA|nr:hypothetical protein JKP88DRAFT_90877 [Tribonema minus]